MNCRQFRHHHDAYVDDTLSGEQLDAMAHHRRLCESCSQLDTRVRRALILARNLPTIEVSASFSERLDARLQAERASMALGRDAVALGRRRSLSMGTYVMIAGVFVVVGLGGVAVAGSGTEDIIRLAPVVASIPETEPSQMTTPTMVAAMPAGMPIWPAVFVAQQASWHLASDTSGR